MSKSTPITQLPASSNPIAVPLTDQQKSQLSQAQQSFPMPLNTQTTSDIIVDDDATIEEALKELNNIASAQEVMQSQSHPISAPPPVMHVAPTPLPPAMLQQPVYIQPSPLHQPVTSQSQENYYAAEEKNNEANPFYQNIWKTLITDLKLIAVLIAVFAIFYMLPIHNFISTQYLAIFQRIPRALIWVKALLAGFVAYALIKILHLYSI